MHFIKLGEKLINLDRVTFIEESRYCFSVGFGEYDTGAENQKTMILDIKYWPLVRKAILDAQKQQQLNNLLG